MPPLSLPPAPQGDVIDERIRAKQVLVLYEQATPAQVISVLVAGMLCLVLWEVADRVFLSAWFVAIAALGLLRLGLVLAFHTRKPEGAAIQSWERRFVFSLAATGLAWGVGGWLLMPKGSLLYQAVIYFFLMGMAAGAVASYSVHAACVSVTIFSIMMPATLSFVLQDAVLPRSLAVGGLIYVGAAYRATRTLGVFLRRSFQLAEELDVAHRAAEQLARTDALTGMNNRRAFYELGEPAFQQARRYGHPLSAVLLDIDRFKSVNDRFGHAAGDRTLHAVAEAIRRTVRGADIPGRVGGEEFAVLLPDTAVGDATALAERLRGAVSSLSIEGVGRVTSSIGVAGCDGACPSLDSLLAWADTALYQAKDAGRDRVVCHVPHPMTP